jgi:hypothetical protein
VTSSFSDLSGTDEMRRERESNAGERLVHMGIMPCSILIDQIMSKQSAEMSKNETTMVEDGGAPTQGS